MLFVAPLPAAIEGIVQNGTTGREQAGVQVTLMKLEQGMMPVGSTRTDASGKFRFVQSVAGSDGQPAPVLLQAVYEGVTYNQMVPPGRRTGDVRLTVYAATKSAVPPEQHILLLEPSGKEMIVNEFFLYRNQTQPPATYIDSQQGTLRFYLPPAAKGIVQASATGPGGMPIRVTAEKSDQPDVYKISLPIKPGENRVDLTYLVPYQSPLEFETRSLYQGLVTRVAAPPGVTLSGDGLQPMPENPQIKASIYAIPEARTFKLTINGEGRLSRDRDSGDGQGGDNISIMPAAVHQQLWVVLGFGLAILALGFYALYTASGSTTVDPAKTDPAPRKRKS
ncbi:MAG: hypothetical protein HY238_28665 [Acidobacteria bacterium]|nr:hypothetical protein [Acidobacteriota bacterium]